MNYVFGKVKGGDDDDEKKHIFNVEKKLTIIERNKMNDLFGEKLSTQDINKSALMPKSLKETICFQNGSTFNI